jgi:ketosteroid isomerase-like protein
MLFAFLACRPKENSQMNPSMVTPSEVQPSIDTQNQVFMNAIQAGNMDSLEMVYSEDGWILPPNNDAVKSLGGIKSFMQDLVESGVNDIQLTSGELHVIGDSNAVETGMYRVFMNDQQVDEGKYMVLWKNEEGAWRIYRDMWNTNMPAPQPADTTGMENDTTETDM